MTLANLEQSGTENNPWITFLFPIWLLGISYILICSPTTDTWTASGQNQQSGFCAPPRLISVWADQSLAVRMKKAWVLIYPLSAQRRLWSDWADAQADPSLRWAHMSFCWFCHDAAHIVSSSSQKKTRWKEISWNVNWKSEWINEKKAKWE